MSSARAKSRAKAGAKSRAKAGAKSRARESDNQGGGSQREKQSARVEKGRGPRTRPAPTRPINLNGNRDMDVFGFARPGYDSDGYVRLKAVRHVRARACRTRASFTKPGPGIIVELWETWVCTPGQRPPATPSALCPRPDLTNAD
jgi:hypothetical protein